MCYPCPCTGCYPCPCTAHVFETPADQPRTGAFEDEAHSHPARERDTPRVCPKCKSPNWDERKRWSRKPAGSE